MPRSPGLSLRTTTVAAAFALVLFGIGISWGIRWAQPPSPQAASPLPPQQEEPEVPSTPPNTSPAGASRSEPEAMDAGPLETSEASNGKPIRWQGPGHGDAPRIAVVIDDLGRSLREVERLSSLGVPISYAVLPYEIRTQEVVRRLSESQLEILLHLPMEARGGNNPGPGAVLQGMSPDEVQAVTRAAVAAVPGLVGANNHMGSSISADRQAMQGVLTVVREAGLFYLDSRTGSDTVGFSMARELGIPAAERQVFLDTKIDREWIRGQFQVLLREAEARGAAVAIGHPYAETLDILDEEVPRALERGFQFVRVSELLDR